MTTHQKLGQLKRIPFTKEGYDKLIKTLGGLQKSRPAAVKELARARELGDLSENGLYTAAKARLNSIDNQIFRAEMTIKLADVVESKNSNAVSIGSRVTVSDGVSEVEYKIVGDTETNPKENKISQHSPIGKSLIGKSIGEETTLKTPAGSKILIIKKIR